MSVIRSLALRLVSAAAVLTGGVNIELSSASAEIARTADTAAIKPVAATSSSGPLSSTSPAALPNGATSLSEVYGDWTVSCSIQSNVKHCDAKQEQINQQSRQLVLAVELVPMDDRIEGVALLPFGLALGDGVTLQIDELPAGHSIQFRTCLPTGCLAPLSFDASATASLRAGATLKAKVVIDGGSETVLSISLRGFSQAIDRTAFLASAEHSLVLKK